MAASCELPLDAQSCRRSFEDFKSTDQVIESELAMVKLPKSTLDQDAITHMSVAAKGIGDLNITSVGDLMQALKPPWREHNSRCRSRPLQDLALVASGTTTRDSRILLRGFQGHSSSRRVAGHVLAAMLAKADYWLV